jgi:hypothetical protein
MPTSLLLSVSEKTELTPRKTGEQVAYASARFSKDGKGVYVATDKKTRSFSGSRTWT